MKLIWSVSVVPAPQRHAQSPSTQIIGKCVIAQIERNNLKSSDSLCKFPVKIINPISVSNGLLQSTIGIISSNATMSPHLGRSTYNEILATVEPAMIFEA